MKWNSNDKGFVPYDMRRKQQDERAEEVADRMEIEAEQGLRASDDSD